MVGSHKIDQLLVAQLSLEYIFRQYTKRLLRCALLKLPMQNILLLKVKEPTFSGELNLKTPLYAFPVHHNNSVTIEQGMPQKSGPELDFLFLWFSQYSDHRDTISPL